MNNDYELVTVTDLGGMSAAFVIGVIALFYVVRMVFLKCPRSLLLVLGSILLIAIIWGSFSYTRFSANRWNIWEFKQGDQWVKGETWYGADSYGKVPYSLPDGTQYVAEKGGWRVKHPILNFIGDITGYRDVTPEYVR